MAESALAGIRVVDLSRIISGGVLTTFLADFGADVIKVEDPRGGDPLRTWGREQLYWKQYGRNKRSITLNLAHPRGQELLKALVRTGDVLVENYVPGRMEKWGLGYDVLSAINPRLVMVRVSGWGQDGPYRERPGFGTMVESMSGFAAMTGQADGPPTLPPMPLADMVAALAGAFGTMAALRHRDATGRGQVIDLALFEPLMAILGPMAADYRRSGYVWKRIGNRSHNSAPRNAYETKDGRWVGVSCSTQASAEALFRALGLEWMIADPRFKDNTARLTNYDDLDKFLGEAFAARTLEELDAMGVTAGSTAAPVYDIEQIVQDPQFKARGYFAEVNDPDMGAIPLPSPVPRLTATPGAIRWTGPALGAHNKEVYCGELCLTEAELETLRRNRVI